MTPKANEGGLEVAVARIQERLDNLEDRFDKHEAKQNGSLDKIWAKLEEMGNRPTWAVSAAITALVGLSSALIVYTVTH